MDEEVYLLFEDAKNKIKKVGIQANDSKKKIVRDLAKNLDGKIPTDTICMEITKRLSGRVSDRFVRECLDERYKDKVHLDIAKMQKNHSLKDKVIDKLAVLPPLGQVIEEGEREKEKEDIIIDTDDRVSIEEKDEHSTIDFSAIPQVSYRQEHQLKEKTDHSLEECPSDKEPVDENREDALEKSSQVTIANKMVTSEEPANTHDDEMDKSILLFEFPIYYKKLQNQMALLFRKSGSDGKVWFNGKIDIKTGNVISKNFGRIEEQQQGGS